jgi:hypothetical protein
MPMTPFPHDTLKFKHAPFEGNAKRFIPLYIDLAQPTDSNEEYVVIICLDLNDHSLTTLTPSDCQFYGVEVTLKRKTVAKSSND